MNRFSAIVLASVLAATPVLAAETSKDATAPATKTEKSPKVAMAAKPHTSKHHKRHAAPKSKSTAPAASGAAATK